MENSPVSDGGDQGWGGESTPPSEAILERLADTEDKDITELPPLYDVIDPDALNSLFVNRDDGRVTFDYCGYEITVTQSGEIIIDE